MATHWNDEQKKQVMDLLRQFNGSVEVCAVMGCAEDELDELCLEAFETDFETAKATFAAQGRALVRKTLMQRAIDGDMKAIDMLAREQLGMDPVKARKAKPSEDTKPEEPEGNEASVLQFILGTGTEG